MMTSPGEPTPEPVRLTRRGVLSHRFRNYFLTGLVLVAPIFITLWIVWFLVGWVDGLIKPLIPWQYNPDNYLPFPIPGFGLLVGLVALTLIGALAANLVGRTLIGFGERLLERMPLVRTIYRASKQIFETVFSGSAKSFQRAGLIEYPRLGLWSVVFIATDARGEIPARIGDPQEDVLSVFLPTTPNPTSGFLLYVKAKDVILLDMTIEEAAKLVISAGLVAPEYPKPVPIASRRHQARSNITATSRDNR
jgi:uncharacterized membrane protein